MTPLIRENVREEVCDNFSNCDFSQRKEEKLRIIITGKTRGYLENCGCKASQNGGVARRETVIQKLRNTASNRAPLIDTGDSLPNEDNSPFLNPNTERSLPLYLSLMNRLNYDAVAIGRNEIRHSVGFLKKITRDSKLKLVNANIQQSGSSIAPGEVKTQIGPLTVRFIGLLEPNPPSLYRRFYEDATSDLVITDPSQAVRSLSTVLHDSDTLNVVIGPISPKKIRELIDENPEIDIVISSDNDFIDPATLPDSVTEQDKDHILKHDHSGYYKQTLVVYADQDTYGVLAVDFGLSSSGRISSAKITRIPLDSSVQENQNVRRMIDNYYQTVAVQSHTQDVKPLFQGDPILENNQYVGAQSCQACHKTEYSHWISTNHSKAFLTLRRIRRELNPDCAICHVTGYGYKPGFSMETLTVDEKKFGGVQCEICHGPGRNHILAPTTSNIRKAPEERTCRQCHTPEHSNAFDFTDRIDRVRHNANLQR